MDCSFIDYYIKIINRFKLKNDIPFLLRGIFIPAFPADRGIIFNMEIVKIENKYQLQFFCMDDRIIKPILQREGKKINKSDLKIEEDIVELDNETLENFMLSCKTNLLNLDVYDEYGTDGYYLYSDIILNYMIKKNYTNIPRDKNSDTFKFYKKLLLFAIEHVRNNKIKRDLVLISYPFI